MSSRSLAAARARRAGDNAPPVSGNRPVTSIGSQAAFAQQMPPHMAYNMPPPPNNVRTARAMPPSNNNQYARPPPQQYQQFYDQQNQYGQQQYGHQHQYDQQNSNSSIPFSKLSISDAIGLITLRLGRVEQWMIDTDAENEDGKKTSGDGSIPENHKIIDNSVLATIISRLDALEKNSGASNLDSINKLTEEVNRLNDIIKRIGDDVTKHSLDLSKNSEQVFRFNRDLTENKDLLKSFMIKYDMFTQETTNNFSDYELALSDLEKRLPVLEDAGQSIDSLIPEPIGTSIGDINEENIIMSVDLKNIIKQELANA